MNAINLRRRTFLASVSAAAGAFSLGWTIPASAADLPAMPDEDAELGIWAVVHPDDSIVVRIARSEMGQGTFTGLAQLVADEMDADWSHVRAEYVPPHVNYAHKRAWGDMSTGGSRGIRTSVDYVRKGGATARAMLISAAALTWGVPEAECSAAKSVVTHAKTGRHLRYGELAARAATLKVPAEVKVKDEKQWTIIGKPVKRLDTEGKLGGKQVFAIDVQLPGMLCATVAQCPVFGGKLVSFDAKAVASMPGVKQVFAIDDHTVAVVAEKFYFAKTALAALPIVWDEGDNAKVSSADIAALLKEGLDAKDAGLGQKHGDVEDGFARAAKTITADYGAPFLNHATLEPMNCTALYSRNGDAATVEIWAPTQNGDASLAAAAEAAELPLSAVKVNKLHLGGGFGRRGQQDFVRQAVAIARQIPGTPVKLIWTREEDMQHCFFRPITQARLKAGLDAKGNVTSLHARISGQSILAYLAPGALKDGVDPVAFQGWNTDEFGYMTIPNLLIDHAMRNTHVPVGFWRGVNTNQNAFYMECFIDELAHAAGKDPLEFRRAMMSKSPKNLAVLNAVAAKAEWGKKLPGGVFRGICQNAGFGSYTAAVAEVSVSKEGKLTIHRIVAATDPGHVVNPDQVRAQVEGSFVYGLSAGLSSEITIEKGRVAQSNFLDYEVMRMATAPRVVETVLAPSGGFWGGVGEPTIAVATPAVMNAIFAATGRRIRQLPLKQQDLTPA
jgi:isoquinoline 1-oxidoreductase beta subunit